MPDLNTNDNKYEEMNKRMYEYINACFCSIQLCLGFPTSKIKIIINHNAPLLHKNLIPIIFQINQFSTI